MSGVTGASTSPRPFSSTCATRRATLSPSMMGFIGVVGWELKMRRSACRPLPSGRHAERSRLQPRPTTPGDVDGPGRGERGRPGTAAARRAAGRRAGPATLSTASRAVYVQVFWVNERSPSCCATRRVLRQVDEKWCPAATGHLPCRHGLGGAGPAAPDAAIFVHLRDAAGNIVAQHDGPIGVVGLGAKRQPACRPLPSGRHAERSRLQPRPTTPGDVDGPGRGERGRPGTAAGGATRRRPPCRAGHALHGQQGRLRPGLLGQ